MLDGLLGYLKDELAMNGEEGCSLDELATFIQDFYRVKKLPQKIDQDYTAFIWSRLSALKEIRVGCLWPVGSRTDQDASNNDVPRASTSKEFDEIAPGTTCEFIELDQETKAKSVSELRERYGTRLRIAVDEETCWFSITGSHNRPSKLTAPCYAILKSIARGRNDGRTAIELGREFTAYDQKSIFHFIKSLLSLDLIVKFRTQAQKAYTNRCIHKRYLPTSEHWAAHIATDPDAGVDQQNAQAVVLDDFLAPASHFSPITVLHLHSNEKMVRARILTVLKKSPAQTMAHSDMIHAINVTPPNTRERRKLNRIIDAMWDEGLISKGAVPSQKGSMGVLQLVVRDTDNEAGEEEAEENFEADNAASSGSETEPLDLSRLRYTLPIERQILDVIQNAGEAGVIQKDILNDLKGLEKRVLDTTLTNLEKIPLPPHLSDNKIYSILENAGREKRVRVFSIQGYAQRCQKDQVEPPKDLWRGVYPEEAGHFPPLSGFRFYDTVEEYDRHVATVLKGKTGIPQNKARPKKEWSAPAKPRAPKKQKDSTTEPSNDVSLAEGQPKAARTKAKPKSKKGIEDSAAVLLPSILQIDTSTLTDAQRESLDLLALQEHMSALEGPPSKRAKGKGKAKESALLDIDSDGNVREPEPPPPKKRGRPKKDPNAPVAPYKRKLNEDGTLARPHPWEKKDKVHDPNKPKRPRKSTATVEDASRVKRPRTAKNAKRVILDSPDPDSVSVPGELEQATSADSAADVAAQYQPSVIYLGQPKEAGQKETPEERDSVPHPRLSTEADVQRSEHAIDPSLIEPSKQSEDMQIDSIDRAAVPKSSDNVTGDIAALSNMIEDAIAAQTINARSFQPYDESAKNVRLFEASENENAWMEVDPPEAGPLPSANTARPMGKKARPLLQYPRGTSSVRRGRKNYSQSVRESEILTAIEDNGGVMEDNTRRLAAAQQVVQRRNEGLAEDAYVPILDKKTMSMALNSLQERGAIKLVTVAVPAANGSLRQVKIVHLAELTLSSPAIKNFIENFHAAFNVVARPVSNVEGVVVNRQHARVTLNPHTSKPLGDDVSEQEIRDYCHNEWRTVSQYLGYPSGRMARARTVHLTLLDLVSSNDFLNKISAVSVATGSHVKIFTSSLLFTDISLSEYVKLLPTSTLTQELKDALANPVMRWLKMSKIQQEYTDIADTLGIVNKKNIRMRNGVMGSLIALASLRLLIPLKRAQVESSEYVLTPANQNLAQIHLESYDPAWLYQDHSSHMLPDAWLFNERVPVWHYAPEETSFRGILPLQEQADAVAYWNEMEARSTKIPDQIIPSLPLVEPAPEEHFDRHCPAPLSLLVEIGTESKWAASLPLTQQKKFLRKQQGRLDDLDPETYNAEVARLADLILLDPSQVRAVLDSPGSRKRKRGTAKQTARKRTKSAARSSSSRKSRSMRRPQSAAQEPEDAGDVDEEEGDEAVVPLKEIQAMLGRKADRLASDRRADFAALVKRFADRVRHTFAEDAELVRLREAFTAGALSEQQLQSDLAALQQIQLRPAAVKLPPVAKKMHRRKPPTAKTSSTIINTPRDASTTTEAIDPALLPGRAADSLAGPAAPGPHTSIQNGFDPSVILPPISSYRPTGEGGSGERQRRKWSVEEDDVLRDFYILMTVRNQLSTGSSLIPWKMLVDVGLIGSHQPAQVRIHFGTIAKNNAAWHGTLVDAWKSKYLQIARTNPESFPKSEDLKGWITLLRAQVFTGRINPHEAINKSFDLPEDSSKIPSTYNPQRARDVTSLLPVDDRLPLLIGNANSNVLRSRDLAQTAFTFDAKVRDASQAKDLSVESLAAHAVIKTIVATPEHNYDEILASSLLQKYDEATLKTAVDRLVAQQVITKVVPGDDRRVPGRNFVFSDKWTQAFNKILPLSNFASARHFSESDTSGLSLIPEDGEMMVFMNLISENQLEASIDTSVNAIRRDVHDYQTRKLDDEAIECTVMCEFEKLSHTDVTFGLEQKLNGLHLLAAPIDISEILHSLPDTFRVEDVQKVWTSIESSGKAGITRREIMAHLGSDVEDQQLDLILKSLLALHQAPVIRVGVDEARFVSTEYLQHWAIDVQSMMSETTYFVPRPWLDFRGSLIKDSALQYCRAILACLHLHANPCSRKLCSLLDPLLTLVEVEELIDHLRDLHLVGSAGDGLGWRLIGTSWLIA